MSEPLVPCKGMETPISRLADGSLTGFMAWYVRGHVKRCHKCGPVYKALLALREAMNKAGQEETATRLLGEDRWREIEEACGHDT